MTKRQGMLAFPTTATAGVKRGTLDYVLDMAHLIGQESAMEAGSIAFTARVLAQLTLPHRDPKAPQFVRVNGNQRLVISNVSGQGLPYGAVPRLILVWLTTEALRRKERHIELGTSLSQFLAEVGLNRSGGPRGDIGRLREQMDRLFSCAIYLGTTSEPADDSDQMVLTDKKRLWWDPRRPDAPALWTSYVVLTESFYNAIIDRPVPIDLRAVSALRRSPLALDLYTWATYRASYASQYSLIPWAGLQLQFGSDYAKTAQGRQGFRRKFVDALKKVQAVYPALRLDVAEKGIAFQPCRTHVPKLR